MDQYSEFSPASGRYEHKLEQAGWVFRYGQRSYKARSLKRAVSAVFGEAARATFEAALKVRD